MQIAAPLTINDGSATPVAKTFSPVRVSPEVSVFAEKSSGVSAGFIPLSVRFGPATANRATNRIDYEIAYPVLSTVNGVSTVAYTLRSKGYFVIPDQATPAERSNLQAYTVNGLNTAAVKAVIKDLDPMY